MSEGTGATDSTQPPPAPDGGGDAPAVETTAALDEGAGAAVDTPVDERADAGQDAVEQATEAATSDTPGALDEAVAAAEVAGDGTVAALDEAEAAMREAAVAVAPGTAAASLTASPVTPSLDAAQPRPEVAAAPVAPAVESRPATPAVTAAEPPAAVTAAAEPATEAAAEPAAGTPAEPAAETPEPAAETPAEPAAETPEHATVAAAGPTHEPVTWDLPESAPVPTAEGAPEATGTDAVPSGTDAVPSGTDAGPTDADAGPTGAESALPAHQPVTWDVPEPVHPAPAGPGAVGPTPSAAAAGTAAAGTVGTGTAAAAPNPVAPTPGAPTPGAPTPGALRPPTPSALRPQPAAPVPSPTPAAGRSDAPAATAPAPGVEPVVPASDPHEFGYVGEDSWIFLRTADGDRPIAQWAAGDPEEGLAFFGRKYDDLVVELELAERRLKDGKANPEQAAQAVKRVREALVEPAFVGDVAGLAARCEQLEGLVKERRQQVQAERLAAKAEALAVREQIVAEAESLVASTQWKSTGDRFRTLLDEWKGAPRVDRAKEQELWKRFSHARSAFDKTRRQHFAQLDAQRKDAVAAKEAIVAEAEALSTSTDWGPTARAYRTLMDRWKASPRASRQDEDRLWQRFRAAQDQFFSARSGVMETRDADLRGNLEAKEAILAEAEALLPITDLKAAKASLRVLQERWEKVGHVPRADKERVEGRMRRVEDALRKAEQDEWRRTNPEARARAEATASQFRASVEKLEAQLAKAEAAGDQRAIADAERSLATTRALLQAAEGAADEFSG